MLTVAQSDGADSRDQAYLREVLMLAQEVLRRAAEIIEAGWSVGATARDSAGTPVPLFKGNNARDGINPAAVSFSIYGAMCKAIHEAGRVERLALVWDVLYRLAKEASETPTGGKNYVHPVIQFNEHDGRTKGEVLALLDLAAVECERIGGDPFPPPVTADPKQLEAL